MWLRPIAIVQSIPDVSHCFLRLILEWRWQDLLVLHWRGESISVCWSSYDIQVLRSGYGLFFSDRVTVQLYVSWNLYMPRFLSFLYIFHVKRESYKHLSLRGQILGLWIYLACLPSPRLLVSFQPNTLIQTTTSALVRDVDGNFLCQLAFAKKRSEPIHSIQVGTLAWAQGLQILYQANPSHAPTCPVCIERRIDKLRIAINNCVQLGHRLKKTFAYFMHSILSSVIFLPLIRERTFPSERYRCAPLL